MPKSALSRRAFIRSSVALSAAGMAAGTAGTRFAFGAAPAFYVPLDTLPHKRTWMAWPDSKAIWGRHLAGIQANIALIASTIARYEPVILCANSTSVAAAQAQCGSSVQVIGSIPVDDCWLRDSGPVFRVKGVRCQERGRPQFQRLGKQATTRERRGRCLSGRSLRRSSLQHGELRCGRGRD